MKTRIGERVVASFTWKESPGPGRYMTRGMVERDHPDPSICQQCALLSIPQSSFCRGPKGEPEQNLAPMRWIDVLFLDTPLFGMRQMSWHLHRGPCDEPDAHLSAHARKTRERW